MKHFLQPGVSEPVAITDHHTPGSKIHHSEDEFTPYLAETEKERAGQDDLRVIKGAEATALDPPGRITIDARRAARLEWVLCDLGGQSEGTLRATPLGRAGVPPEQVVDPAKIRRVAG